MSDPASRPSQNLLDAKRKLRAQTRDLRGIEGCGTDGVSLRIYVSDDSVKPRIPLQVDGFNVVVVPSGPIRAQTPRATGPASDAPAGAV